MSTQSSSQKEPSKKINAIVVQVLLKARQQEQQQLARFIGVSKQHTTSLLKGTRGINGHLPAIARFFDVNEDTLTLDTTEKTIPLQERKKKMNDALLVLIAEPRNGRNH